MIDAYTHTHVGMGSNQDLPQTEELEKLVLENTKILDTWRLFLQPGSTLRHLNIERKISKLMPEHQPPNYKDWMFATGLEIMKTGMYAWPIVYMGIKAYQSFTGSQ